MHNLLEKLLTREKVHSLGFVSWDLVEGLLERAFHKGEAKAMRDALVVAQWVVIGQRFGVKKAEPAD